MSDRCGDSPMKTILLCHKATLIPLCETCKAGPPTAALCERELCVSSVSIPPTATVGMQILCICTYMCVNMCKYEPPTKLCVCWGLCGQHITFLRRQNHTGMIWRRFGGSFKVPELGQESHLWKWKTGITLLGNRTVVDSPSWALCRKCMWSPINPAWRVQLHSRTIITLMSRNVCVLFQVMD